jgi:general secretion pathway protein A
MCLAVAVAVATFATWRLMPEKLPVLTQLTAPAATPTPEKPSEVVNPPVAAVAAAPDVQQQAGAAPVTPPPVTLAELLADPEIPTDTDTAFQELFSHWGLKYDQYSGDTGCERAQQAGLRCLFESGTWNNLRLLNRPAIIELADDSGTRHHVLVSQLTEEQVTLEFPGREVQLPLAEVDRVWFGKYLLLWSPPAVGDRVIRRGMRGTAVSWVRDVLDRYGLPKSRAPDSDRFDAELEAKVKEFQRRHQLRDDGVIGQSTLVYLRTYDSNAQSPQITAARDVPAVH